MKWIGQHIVSLIARFRSDVYLEDISTGTIASGAHLGLDSNNKIVKAVDGGGDLTSIVAGTGLSGTDLTGPIPTLNVDASIPEITTLAGLTSIGTDGDTLNILGDTVTIVNTTSSKPAMNFTNQADDASGPIITLKNQRVDSSTQAGEANDFLGKIFFTGFDDQGTPGTQNYASVTSQIHDATSGQESGILNLQVANHDGGLETGLKLTGGSVNSEIDVAVGLGAASVVTIPGNIDLAGDIDVDGTLETDALTIGGATIAAIGTTAITTLGTIGTGVWQGTAIASAYLDADTAHLSATRLLTYHGFSDDIDTTKHYIGLLDADSENPTAGHQDMPFVFPTAGKLLKVFLRSNQNFSGNTLTWRLETQALTVNSGTGPSVIGTQSGVGCTNNNMTTYDFTSSLDSGTNVIAAGDTVFLSVQSDATTPNGKFFITCLWENDLS